MPGNYQCLEEKLYNKLKVILDNTYLPRSKQYLYGHNKVHADCKLNLCATNMLRGKGQGSRLEVMRKVGNWDPSLTMLVAGQKSPQATKY